MALSFGTKLMIKVHARATENIPVIILLTTLINITPWAPIKAMSIS
jgi:hypothetical protein